MLRFWHQVEFFIPFDLRQQVLEARDAEWAVRSWSIEDLRRKDQPLWQPPVPCTRRLIGFDVYFGLFDKSQLAEVTQHALRETLNAGEIWEQDERGELEGPTCIARMRTGPAGEPLLEDVSVSTAPWALGRLQRHGADLAALDFDAFQDDVQVLKARLREFRAEWRSADGEARAQQMKADGAKKSPPLSGDELSALLAIFEEWAHFSPSAHRPDDPAVVIRAKSVESPKRKAAAETVATPAADGRETGATPPAGGDSEAADETEEGAGAEGDIEVDILNSFFATDIARAIASVERGDRGGALEAFLTPVSPGRRLDLYGPEGREHIFRTLFPDRLPPARWPDPPTRAMSLMQQFAINSLLARLASGGMFSVNGPPGTGKTTLLRDVFAELITRRARVLASLAGARDAFSGAVALDFQGEKGCLVARLREDLAGYEMVVASSNNTAVENLSRDLPKAKALGKAGETPWRDRSGVPAAGYLRTVAHNIACRTAKGDYVQLCPDDLPWGLIACTLGKKRNRSDFAYRLSADARNAGKPPRNFDPDAHQSLWTWRDKYQGPGFAAAREAFATADEAVRQRLAALDRYATLSAELHGQTLESFVAPLLGQVAQSRRAMEAARTARARVDHELALCEGQLALLREEALLIERGRPAWWLRWFQPKRRRQYLAESEENRQQQRQWLRRRLGADAIRLDAERQAEQAMEHLATQQRSMARRQRRWDVLQREWKSLAELFPQTQFPVSSAVLEDHRWQIDGLGHDPVLNELRSDLFIAALGLHEAWLAEVLKRGGGFGPNLVAATHLLSGKRLQQREHALVVWQSLFMVVPVVSSTFASIASQFHDLGHDSLGWLFIDEAGQVVPQAAVGALWRARRAVVVGDPLQIEPVFTVPIRLIEALARAARLPVEPVVAPHRASVQNLADQANALGVWTDAGEARQWIGSPLRVHRRCVDPMFTIANAIAYEGKMIFYDLDDPALRLPPADSLDLGPSAWVDVGGAANNKQVVQAQVDLVCRALQMLYVRTGHQLPALYVISPFRRIKEDLVRRLSDTRAWSAENPPRADRLRDWCRNRIGTVHTFQGKEESLVFMVLGCDARTRGAAQWAAGKPNLLNVALTRAKHRFFVIGATGLWGSLPHFSSATEALLPRISAAAFVQRLVGER